MKKYCCEVFHKWMGPNHVDEYIGEEDDGKYMVMLQVWQDNHQIFYCPFCGSDLRSEHEKWSEMYDNLD